MSEQTDTVRCSECGHETTADELENRPRGEECHECGAHGNHKGYFPVWYCPNCSTGYAGSCPTIGNGGVEGCNRCFVSVPENYLRAAVQSGDASFLERFLPDEDRSMFPLGGKPENIKEQRYFVCPGCTKDHKPYHGREHCKRCGEELPPMSDYPKGLK